MVRKFLLWFFSIPVLGLQGIFLISLMEGPEVKVELPKPDYHPRPTDPAWLAQAVQFHGHLGPWATAGIRFGAAGRRAVGARGYFDLEVRCQGPLERPPRACFLDGLQVGTGATLGKRNLHWEPGEELVVWVKNIRTGQTAELRPTKNFWEMLTSLKTHPKAAAEDQDHDHQVGESREAAGKHHLENSGLSGRSTSAEAASSKAGSQEPPQPAKSGRTESSSASGGSGGQTEHPDSPVEAMAREIAAMSDAKILSVEILPSP